MMSKSQFLSENISSRYIRTYRKRDKMFGIPKKILGNVMNGLDAIACGMPTRNNRHYEPLIAGFIHHPICIFLHGCAGCFGLTLGVLLGNKK